MREKNVDSESWSNKLSMKKKTILRPTSQDQDQEYNFLILGLRIEKMKNRAEDNGEDEAFAGPLFSTSLYQKVRLAGFLTAQFLQKL